MTPAELVAAGWQELTKTTDSYPKWKQRGFPAGTHWSAAKALFDQVGQAPPPPPPPPPPSGRYTDIRFTGGRYDGEGIDSVFEAVGSDPRLSDWGGTDPNLYDQWGMTHDQNQRVHLIPNLSGRAWASWQELRTSDGPWVNGYNLAKASLNIKKPATWGPGGWQWGLTRWFAFDIFFPLNIDGVSYERPASGWNTLGDMHSSDSGLGADPGLTELYDGWLTHSTTPDPRGGVGVPYLRTPLLQLWNGGSRVASAFNTWHEVVIGMKATADSTGWFEVWCDGVQKAPRTSRQLFDPSEGGPYFQLQNYCEHPTRYVGGATRSAVVYGGFRAGMSRTDVQTR